MAINETKSPGRVRRTLAYLASPRLFMSSESTSKYGAFSLTYHRQILRDLYDACLIIYARWRLGENSEDVDISGDLTRYFDSLYEAGHDKDSIVNLHRNYCVHGRILIGVAAVLATIFVISLVSGIDTFIGWLFAISASVIGASIAIKGLTFLYYACVLEDKLLPERFPFSRYLTKDSFRFPTGELQPEYLAEVVREFEARDALLLQLLKKDGFTLDSIGLDHLKGRFNK